MLTYQYNSTNGLLVSSSLSCDVLCFSRSLQPREDAAQSPEPGVFVSTVSWRGIGNTLIAANSQGQIKVSLWCSTLYILSCTHSIETVHLQLYVRNTSLMCVYII